MATKSLVKQVHKSIAKRINVKGADLGDVALGIFHDYGGGEKRPGAVTTAQSPRAYLAKLDADDND